MKESKMSQEYSVNWVTGISAITVFAENLLEAKQFYTTVFSTEVVYEDEVSCVFQFGNTVINLLQITEANELVTPAWIAAPDAGARTVFTITVEDVDATCELLKARGVELLNGPMDRPWGIRTASFMDPAGQIWEIAH